MLLRPRDIVLCSRYLEEFTAQYGFHLEQARDEFQVLIVRA
jgi:hypothetical protein